VLLVVGSSLEVFPAADLPALALRRGAKVIIVNREPTDVDGRAAVVIHSDAALALPALVEEVSHVLV
jgi:NAD-dependent deacetylase